MTHVWEAAISAAAAACSVVLLHGGSNLNDVAHNAASSSMATQSTVNCDTARDHDDTDDEDKDASRPRKRCKKWGGMPVYMQQKKDT